MYYVVQTFHNIWLHGLWNAWAQYADSFKKTSHVEPKTGSAFQKGIVSTTVGRICDYHEPPTSLKSFKTKIPWIIMNILSYNNSKCKNNNCVTVYLCLSHHCISLTMLQFLQSWISNSQGDQTGLGLHQSLLNFAGIQTGLEVWNDLQVAVEVDLGESKAQVIYPDAKLKLTADVYPQLSVHLREDPNVWGRCTFPWAAVRGSTVRLSNSFGGFGDFADRAREHTQKEARAAEEESRLRKQRQEELDQKLGAQVTQAVLKKQKRVMISIFFCMLMVLAAMISCTVISYNLQLTEPQGLDLAVGLLLLWACAGCGVAGLGAAAGVGTASGLRDSVQAARPELRRYQGEGVEAGRDWRVVTFGSCACCAPLVFLGCVVAMTAAFHQSGTGHLSALLWGPVAMLMCYGAVFGSRRKGGSWAERAVNALFFALFFLFWWPFLLFEKCFGKGLVELVLAPPKRSLDAAVHTAHERTIVFEGNVLPKRETVCSWPGKYETAWSELVAGSRHNDISAAVVFLPEGSEHFGFHDPIPAKFAKQDLQDLHGECWCTPLYGEQKPWGCRWWSKWIANIELAVSQECTLVVYYFNGMKGLGKVENFTTAGEEHMRREAIFRCKDAFLKSDTFQNAVEAGLNRLSKEQGPDSSSPYSREVHRLFLAWLPEPDRQFLESSEGLGNSQKAEVAWLERNRYPYVEKNVWELESSSPKAK